VRILQAFGKSRKAYENQKEVYRRFIVIQSTDNFILFLFIYLLQFRYFFTSLHIGHLAPLDMPKLPLSIASQFLLLSVNAVTFSVKELLCGRNPNPTTHVFYTRT
jgi:hypothetical protein